ncbi:MAG: HAMP domain-containing histidine kinase, partial [Oscillospiraceae bacterium]|nr:HAMP domain-containing histidine kinase [Oscillospiraceae bacterium]
EERMKSERMKTELITNVSHDIKTPLTSIINCVDIMKNSGEEFSDQTKEYLDILSRQSLRLKKLTEDVLEASKASTGNIAVELAPIDMGLLLSQAMGEYSVKFEEKGIKTVINIAEEYIFALGDGRLLWRVFDNIFSNISRYSLSGTRAYIDVFKANGMVYATFKNVSSYELPIDSKELLERFVRADASRNSEGSGLGLSISEDLCSLMGGKLNISTEADLFKATVTLPVCSPVPHKPQNN